MNYLIKFYQLTVLCFSFSLMADEKMNNVEEVIQIENIQISEAKWTHPSDGSAPQLLNYNILLTLNDKNIVSCSQINNLDYPIAMWKKGDVIEILREGFFTHSDQSWFHVRHIATDKEIDLIGNSRNKKIFINAFNDPDVHAVRRIDLHEEASQSFLHFEIEGTHYVLPIEDAKYHNFYVGMPLKIVSKYSVEMAFDKYGIQCTFMNMRTSEVFVADSIPMTTATIGVIEEVKIVDFRDGSYFDYDGGRVALYSYRLEIILEDGHSFLLEKNINSSRNPNNDQNNIAYRAGDSIEILKEDFLAHDPWRSFFSIKNLHNQAHHEFIGTARKPRATVSTPYKNNKIVAMKNLSIGISQIDGARISQFQLGNSTLLFHIKISDSHHHGLYEGMLFAIISEKEISRNQFNQRQVRLELYNFETKQIIKITSYASEYLENEELQRF